MDDDQKWLEAAAGIEQDIRYLKAAMGQQVERAIHRTRTGYSVFESSVGRV